jgi:MFS transporter, PAT family, beta-lactamase induction signal transducer AmpG
MQAGMLLGRSLLGGGALLVHERFGSRALVLALVAVVVVGLLLAPFYRDPGPAGGAPGRSDSMWTAVRRTLARRTTWFGLAFAALGGAGFEAVGGFAGPALTDAAAGDTGPAARFFLLPAVVAAAGGGFLGGWLSDRSDPRRATVRASLLLTAAIAVLAVLFAMGSGLEGLALGLFAVYVAIGAFTASSYALFMSWTDPRLAATQFSALMGATNLCEAWSVALAGVLIADHGYAGTFLGLQLLALGAVVLLVGLRGASNRHVGPA